MLSIEEGMYYDRVEGLSVSSFQKSHVGLLTKLNSKGSTERGPAALKQVRTATQ